MRRRNRGGGSRGRRRASEKGHHFPRPPDSLHTDLAFAIEVRADLAALRFFGHADGVELVMFAQFVAVHAGTTAPSSSRKFLSAARTQVFTVPSGWPMRSAISVCDSPSKYASSITWRWLGESFSTADFTRRALSELQNVLLHVAVQRGMVGLVEFQGIAFAAAGRPQVVDGTIARHRQQPWPDRALLRIEAVNPIPYAQESLLHQVFGDARIADHAQNQREGYAAVAIVKFGQSVRVAPLHARDEAGVVFAGVNGHQDGKQHHSRIRARRSRASNCIYGARTQSRCGARGNFWRIA